MKNQVLLVSDQPMPNFIPILNAELKPETVTLIVSDRMKSKAEWLKREIRKQQVEVLDDILIGDRESDVAAVQNCLLEWASEHEEILKESTLNVTGGTKPMAIAAQELFRSEGRPVFYVDIRSDTVSWIADGERSRPSIHLKNSPTLTQFFGLMGIAMTAGDFKSQLENEKWRCFCDEVAQNVRDYASALGGLNHLASAAESNRDLTFDPHEQEFKLPKWKDLDEMLSAHELVRTNRAGKREFVSAEARRFCNGIWLEHYVFTLLKEFGFDRKRALMNVKVGRENGGLSPIENEFDAVVLHKNTCYVIECKTRNMNPSKKNGLVDVADAAVYKLAELSGSLGLRATGILVSAREVRKEDKDRAKYCNVRVFSDLTTLKQDFAKVFA